jgi:hypothetical protein
MSVSRRDVLKSLSMGAAATSVLRVIPLQAAEYAHHMIDSEKAASKAGVYTPKYFPSQQYKTLQSLCESIFPADADCGGATEAGAPEFIDLLTSENPHYQLTLGGGLMWLATAENRDARSHRLSQEHRAGSKPEPGSCLLLVFAQPYSGRLLYQQDWHRVSGLHRKWVSGGISRVSTGARRLAL